MNRCPEANILVNARFLTRRITGVERYAHEISRWMKDQTRLVRAPASGGGLTGQLWEQFVLPTRVRRDDLLWSPANSGPLAVANQVVTIHDLSPLDHPEWFQPPFRLWYRYLMPRLARRARKVITVSHFSKQRIVARLRLRQDKIVVVPPGVDPVRFHPVRPEVVEAVRSRHGLPERYILYVGSLSPRKNLTGLLRAWERVQPGSPQVAMVIAGVPAQTHQRLPRTSLPPGARLLGYFPDPDLPALYAGALALVMPSLYEGCGLPILEAMACGTPVLASNITGMPEVAGTAGLLVDPGELSQIAAALERLLGDAHLRATLSHAGLEQAAHFSWEQSARSVLEVLKQCAS